MSKFQLYWEVVPIKIGKIIQKDAANTIKKVTLELGGKSPTIVLAGKSWYFR